MIDVPIYHHPDYPVRRAYKGDAGLDLPTISAKWMGEEMGCWLLKTGVHVAIPEGYEGQVRMRSSVGRNGLFICNSPGTIDSGYRGEITGYVFSAVDPRKSVCFPDFPQALGCCTFQLVICPVPKVNLITVGSPSDLPPGVRGDKGFGSSGR